MAMAADLCIVLPVILMEDSFPMYGLLEAQLGVPLYNHITF